MSQNSLKIRNVLNDPRNEDICLDDLIKGLARLGEKFRHVEYKNSMHSYREASKALNDWKRELLQPFEVRFRGEIKEAIVLAKSKVDNRIDPKNPNSFKKAMGDD